MAENRYARNARARARKLRAGADLAPKETAKVLSDAALEIDRLERRLGSVDELERKLAEAQAWRAGFETGRMRSS